MINWKNILLLAFFNLFASFSFASNQATESNSGTNYFVNSKIFGEEQRIQIYLPDDYKNSSKEYPVMYVMDGDWYFLHGVSYQKSLSYIEHSPEYIVVGITTDPILFNRQSFFRTKEFQLKRSKLTNYLAKEIIPFMEKQFRVSDERIYFGWEIAGLLGADIFAQHTELFTGYILASPTPLLDDQIEKIERALNNETMKNKFIYFSTSQAESWTTGQTNKLAKLLKEKAPKSLKWKYDILEGEDHYSTPIPAIYQGLKTYFSDYFPIRFNSLKEFNDFGGLTQLYAH